MDHVSGDDNTLILSVGIFPDKRDGQALFLRRKNQEITDKTKSRFQDFVWDREISNTNGDESIRTVAIHNNIRSKDSTEQTYYISKYNRAYDFKYYDPLYSVFSSISENFTYDLVEFTYQELRDIIDKSSQDNDCYIHKTYSIEIPIYCQT